MSADELIELRDKVLMQRNFHYENFNKWSTYFYIVIGALFVGFYTAVSNNLRTGLQLIIACLGYMVSVCWILSNKGYHYWEMHWTYFLLDIEKNIQKYTRQEIIYSVFYYTQPEKRNNRMLELNNGNYICPISPANVSTSKIAMLVSYVITFAWCLLLCMQDRVFGVISKLHEIIPLFSDKCFVIVVAFIITMLTPLFGFLVKSKIDHNLRHYVGVNKINNKPMDKCKQICISSAIIVLIVVAICAIISSKNYKNISDSSVSVENVKDDRGDIIPLKVTIVDNEISAKRDSL